MKVCITSAQDHLSENVLKKKSSNKKATSIYCKKSQIDATQFSFYAMPPQFLKTVSFPKEF